MKSISRKLIVAIWALTAFCDALEADNKWLEKEALGKISLGQLV